MLPLRKMKQEKTAGGIIYTKDRYQQVFFLLIKSTYWGFPKGWVEEAESQEAAAKREIKEETNLDVYFIPGFSYKQQWFFKMKKHLIKKDAIFFIAKIPIEDVIKVRISDEHSSYQWSTYEEALKFMKIKANRDMLTAAYNFIKEYEAQKRLL